MNYQFFIQEQPKAGGGYQSRLIIVLTNDKEAMAQTSMQALITRHQMHTCVNLPFGNGYSIKFRVSYADMDGTPHPILVIFSSHQGAFKLPFEAGKAGYANIHRTYKRMKIALVEYSNKKAERLAHQSAQTKRLGTSQQSVQRSARVTEAVANGSRSMPYESHQSASDPSVETRYNNVSCRPRQAANEPEIARRKNTAQRNSNVHTKKTNSGSFIKWTVGSAFSVLILLVLALAANSVAAAERPDQENSSTVGKRVEAEPSFAGFPVPKMNLETIKASKATACSIPDFDQAVIPALNQQKTDQDKG